MCDRWVRLFFSFISFFFSFEYFVESWLYLTNSFLKTLRSGYALQLYLFIYFYLSFATKRNERSCNDKSTKTNEKETCCFPYNLCSLCHWKIVICFFLVYCFYSSRWWACPEWLWAFLECVHVRFCWCIWKLSSNGSIKLKSKFSLKKKRKRKRSLRELG